MGIGSSKKHLDFGGQTYTVERLVGRGAFGKVYAILTKEGELVALKQLSKRALLSKKAVQGTLREREFLAELEHPFLVNLRGAFQNHTHLLMLLDFMKGGDLTYHLDRLPNQVLPEDHVRFYLANIALVLEYIHGRGIVHRDLKPDNILLDQRGFAMLTDFNVARRLEADGKISGYAGTFAFMAPELFVKHARYDASVDVWSLGVIMFRLLFGRVPWEYPADKPVLDWLAEHPEPNFRVDPRDNQRQQTAKRIMRGRITIPPGASPEATDLMHRMIAPAHERASSAQIRKHAWFAAIDWDALLEKTAEPPFVPAEKPNVDAALYVEDVFAGKAKEEELNAEEQSLFYQWNFIQPKYLKMEQDAIKNGTFKPRKKPSSSSLVKHYPKLRIMQEKHLKSIGQFPSPSSSSGPSSSSSPSSSSPSSSSSSSSAAPRSIAGHMDALPKHHEDDDYGIKPEPELGRHINANDEDLVAVSQISPSQIESCSTSDVSTSSTVN